MSKRHSPAYPARMMEEGYFEQLPKEWEEFGEIPIGFPPITTRINPFTIHRHLGESAAYYFVIGLNRATSFSTWMNGKRGMYTDTRPTNITEGAD